MTAVVRSGDYEGQALQWLLAQVTNLRRALARAGVTDEGAQRSVCEWYFFGLTVEFDDAEAVSEPRARRRLGFEDGDELLLPDDDTFGFHEYVHGIVGEAFGDAYLPISRALQIRDWRQNVRSELRAQNDR